MKAKRRKFNSAARHGLTALAQMRDRLREIKRQVPVHREPELEACLDLLEILSNAIFDGTDIGASFGEPSLRCPGLFLASLSSPERRTGWEDA